MPLKGKTEEEICTMKAGWTIGRKMLISFLGITVITLLLGLVGTYGISQGARAISEIGLMRLPGVESLLTIVESETRIKAAQRTLMNPNVTGSDRQRQSETISKAESACENARKRYEPLEKSAEEAAAWKEFVVVWDQWGKDNTEFLKLNGELEAVGIPNPSLVQRDLFEVRGTLWKTLSSLNKQIKDGVALQETDITNTLLVKNPKDWTESFKVTNPSIVKSLEILKPLNTAMMASVQSIQQVVAKGDMTAARDELDRVFTPNAMKIIEAMRPMRAEAGKAEAVYEKMNQQGMTVCRVSQLRLEELLGNLVKMNTEKANTTVQTDTAMAAFLRVLSIASMVFGVVLALGLGFLISRGINVALRRISSNLSEGGEQTASAAGQVAESSQAMAEGASEQAASLEQTSASLAEMTSMTQQNADHAIQAAKLMAQATEVIGGMSQAATDMLTAIAEIKASADQTAKIVKTIDEIAFQTNLLALNAAVEAARAGEAGKGFAVVAEEVRNLAQRSAMAAKNTATLIEGSVKNADNGVQVARRVSSALEQAVEKTGKVSQIINEIAAANKEQAQGIAQVSTAVSQMDGLTQANAASAEESASASEELSAQAAQLNALAQELVAMVGGTHASAATAYVPVYAPIPKQIVNRRATLPVSGRDRRMQLPSTKTVSRATVRPEQILPFDEE